MFTALCHGSMCRRERSAPAVAWVMYRENQVAFSKDDRGLHASPAEARRGFCRHCGTQISFTASFIPGLIDLPTGSLDRPEEVSPALHYWGSRRLPWLKIEDRLPRYPELPPVS